MFEKIAHAAAGWAGKPSAFAIACLFILAWAIAGPFLAYSEAWMLIVNTGTTIITFLMLFLLQATQMRDTKAINLKLDELVKATEGARDDVAHSERRPLAEIEQLDEPG